MQRLCREASSYESVDACKARVFRYHSEDPATACARTCSSLGGARKRKTLRNNKLKNKNKNTKRKTRRN